MLLLLSRFFSRSAQRRGGIEASRQASRATSAHTSWKEKRRKGETQRLPLSDEEEEERAEADFGWMLVWCAARILGWVEGKRVGRGKGGGGVVKHSVGLPKV